jgi:hypothetical protein
MSLFSQRSFVMYITRELKLGLFLNFKLDMSAHKSLQIVCFFLFYDAITTSEILIYEMRYRT